MTIRTSKLVTLLMVGAALAATPALAQAVTSGNKGPADIATNRDAPLVLPGELTANTPKVDISITRNIFAMDPADALASLTTVTFDSSTGEVTETEASEALRAAFEAQTKGNTGN